MAVELVSGVTTVQYRWAKQITGPAPASGSAFVGHGPLGVTQAGSVYSDPFVVCLFPYGELAYALSSLTRAWVSLFLGAVMGDLAASAVVGVIAFPVGFFYGAVASAATWGVAKLARSLRSSRATA